MSLIKNKRFNTYHLLLFAGIVALTTFSLTSFCVSNKNTEQVSNSSSSICNFHVTRLNGLKYIRPILFVDEECESDNLSGIRQQVTEIINRYKTTEGVTAASVYLKNHNGWTAVGDNEKYQPGSLFKIPVLITILKMNEKNPGFLDKVFTYDRQFISEKNVAYASKTIKFGQSYTVRELLKYMIQYSDNNATTLLESHMNLEIFKKIFDDFGLTVPKPDDKVYFITAREYSFLE